MTSKAWSIRPYQEGDGEKIRGLFRTVYSRDLDAKEWEWRYLSNPSSLVAISIAETEHGEVIGQYALQPIPMKVEDRNCLGTLSLDTMTHPDFRNQGMFVKLAEHNYAFARRNGVVLTYGFPNENSRHGFFRRLDWRPLAPAAPVYLRPMKMDSLLKNRFGSRRTVSLAGRFLQWGWNRLYSAGAGKRASCDVLPVKEVDPRWDHFWNRVSSFIPVGLIRNAAFMRWRYLAHPVFPYALFAAVRDADIVGYVVLRLESRFGMRIGHIVDLLAQDERAFGDLLHRSLLYFEENGAEIASFLMMPRFAKAEHLGRFGFFRLPARFSPQELYLGVRSHEPSLAPSLSDPDRWYITWGDHDRV